jgi:hypothetical protein
MKETEIRLECLKLATACWGNLANADAIVRAAKQFYEFSCGFEENERSLGILHKDRELRSCSPLAGDTVPPELNA